MISAPNPLSAPIHSPTMAPITAVAVAMRSYENSIGKERGKCRRKKISNLLAESMRNSSSSFCEAEARPRIMFTSVGKKQMMAAMMILGVMPKPKIKMMIGERARMGMVLKNSTILYLIKCDWCMIYTTKPKRNWLR